MSSWLRVGRITEIARQGAKVVELTGCRIAIFRTLDDRIFALEDSCPHRGGPLSVGLVHGNRVTCPLHDWVIELASGTAVSPDQGCVRRFDVRVKNAIIYLALPEEADSELKCAPT